MENTNKKGTKMNLEERVQIAILPKYYGRLLTERQQSILNMYVDNNLSLAEVSEELGISRQAVKDALDNSMQTLKDTEEKLKLIERDNKIKQILENSNLDTTTKIKLIALMED